VTLAQAMEILGPIRAHKVRWGPLLLDQKRAAETEVIEAAWKRIEQKMGWAPK